MEDWFITPCWLFLTLGALLLILELLTMAGYALWCGVAALLVSALSWQMPELTLPELWIIFALLALVVAYLWWRLTRKRGRKNHSGEFINDPLNELLGLKTIVSTEIINGHGRVKVRDNSWIARCDEDLPVGAAVKVVEIKDMVLHVVPVTKRRRVEIDLDDL